MTKSTRERSKKSSKEGQLENSVNKLPETMNANETNDIGSECTICLGIPNGEKGSLKCTHTFCYDCIFSWSKRENTCPLCKERFTSIEKIAKSKKRRKVTVKAKSQSDEFSRSRIQPMFVDFPDIFRQTLLFSQDQLFPIGFQDGPIGLRNLIFAHWMSQGMPHFLDSEDDEDEENDDEFYSLLTQPNSRPVIDLTNDEEISLHQPSSATVTIIDVSTEPEVLTTTTSEPSTSSSAYNLQLDTASSLTLPLVADRSNASKESTSRSRQRRKRRRTDE